MPDRNHESLPELPDHRWRLELVKKGHTQDDPSLAYVMIALGLLIASWAAIYYAVVGLKIWWKAIFG